MIISHKYKFLFIGLPFSASSAITKELHKRYSGEPYLRKHSLYHEFMQFATKEEQKYFVFAVLRNPMEIVITNYEKMKINAKGNFTNPKLFKENGGHISKKQRKKYYYIQNNNATFQEYFLKFHKTPFNNLASITLDNCDYIIRYENLNNDYQKALESVGIKEPEPLPMANKTISKKNAFEEYYTEEIQKRAASVFGPFFKKYKFSFPNNWKNKNVPYFSYILFNITGLLRKWKWKYKKQSERKSIKGSIYGDIQREKENIKI